MPIVELFKQKGKCIEVNTGQKRDVVYAEVKAALAPMTESLAVLPLTEKSEILLGAPTAASPPLAYTRVRTPPLAATPYPRSLPPRCPV